jgi:outer membrane receptor for ferrienterochelin and colicins
VTDRLSSQLGYELRSDRYRGLDATTGEHLYFEEYNVFNLSAQYEVNDFVTISARVNNLLDEDFTSYQTTFVDLGNGTYEPNFQDDYNNKDKARSYWVSLNARF